MESLMPRFYFNLASKDAHIPDDSGKELATLNAAMSTLESLFTKYCFT
jgi:hypothetical protein